MATSVGPHAGSQADLEQLVRQELARAKAEVREDARRAGRTAGLLGGAVFAGYMVLCFLSLTLMFLLWGAMDLRWAALVVTAVWAVAAFVLFTKGRQRMRGTAHAPERTAETSQGDAARSTSRVRDSRGTGSSATTEGADK